MKGFIGNIAELTETNSAFRRVLYTGENLQLVLMSIAPGSEIGSEVHSDVDQFFRVESGHGEIWIDGVASKIEESSAIVVPAKTKHNLVNMGSEPLRLYTIYSPPQHQFRTVQETKADASSAKEHFESYSKSYLILSTLNVKSDPIRIPTIQKMCANISL